MGQTLRNVPNLEECDYHFVVHKEKSFPFWLFLSFLSPKFAKSCLKNEKRQLRDLLEESMQIEYSLRALDKLEPD